MYIIYIYRNYIKPPPKQIAKAPQKMAFQPPKRQFHGPISMFPPTRMRNKYVGSRSLRNIGFFLPPKLCRGHIDKIWKPI